MSSYIPTNISILKYGYVVLPWSLNCMCLFPSTLAIKDTGIIELKCLITFHLLSSTLYKHMSQNNNIKTTSTNYDYSKQLKIFVYVIPIFPLTVFMVILCLHYESILSVWYDTLSCFTLISSQCWKYVFLVCVYII